MISSKVAKPQVQAPVSTPRSVWQQRPRAISRGSDEGVGEDWNKHERGEIRTAAWDFGGINLFAPRPPRGVDAGPEMVMAQPAFVLQRKLAVGRVDDPLENEADRVADQVMRMPLSGVGASAAPPSVSGAAVLRRECACGGGCDKCKNKAAGQEDGSLQRKLRSQGSLEPTEAPSIVHETLRSPGQPLDGSTRRFFEWRFGHNFGPVRVHTDARAAKAASVVNARAYTVGHHIVFGAGQYDAANMGTSRLMAHELTHVIQQTGSSTARVQRDTKDAPATVDPASPDAKQESELERQWGQLKGVAGGFAETKGWIEKGDAIVALMQQHEDGYIGAIHARDADLAVAYKSILDTDLLEYKYIAWHAFVYQNLLRARHDVDSLVSSFDADKRHFTGRDETEPRVRELKRLIESVGKDSARTISGLVTDHLYKFRAGKPDEVSIIVSDATFKGRRPALEKETHDIKFLQLTAQVIIEDANKFLWTARKEGAWQAVEAVKEYYEVMSGFLDSDDGPDVDDTQKSGSGSGGGGSAGGDSGDSDAGEEKKKQKRKGGVYSCTAKCQQQCPSGTEGYISGTSGQNCSVATQNAKSQARRGCYPRHCSCSDTDGFRGKGTQCENHTR